MSDYYQVKNQNIFNPPANTYLGNATNQFNSVYVQNDLVLGNVTVTGSTIVAPKVSTITYPGDDTAADTAGGQTITLTGAGFVVGASVLINGSAVSVVSVVSSTTITFTSPANSTGSYVIYVINPDGSTAIAIPGIQYSGTPNWTTAAGSLGNVYETASFNQTVTATGDAPITYSVYSGTLPPGATFNSNGTISGTSQLLSSPTTYTFTIRATDAQQQDTNRSFSLTVTPDVVTWSNPTNDATYTPAANVAIANITLSATSAVGSGITYSANTLPTGLSLTGANISGTPTVVANTSSLLTATANTTSESSSITINWVVSVASDPYFMYNTLLLPGNGTNNANNNTFLDSSTNNFTITRNGNTTQGTFSPYGPNWSNYFNGSSNYVRKAGSGVLTANGDVTIECWIYPSSTTVIGLFDAGPTETNIIRNYGNNKIAKEGQESTGATFTVTANTWQHFACTFTGGNIKVFINGSLNASGTYTGGYAAGLNFDIGTINGGTNGSFNGYISSFRVTKSVLYTTTFTPSTTPLTAIANTSLLTCQSNRFIDNSSNAYTLTLLGTPTIQRFSPFSPGSAYSTSVIGGSGYFDGTGDYWTAAADTAFDFGTGDFTIECWVYPITNGLNYPTFLSGVTGWSSGASGHRYNNTGYANKFWFGLNGSGGVASGDPFMASTNTFPSNAWHHYALTRSGNTWRMFINGALENTQTFTGSYNAGLGGLRSGWSTWDGAQGYFTGYTSNLRMVKGTALYTAAFTPPTSPVSAVAGTSLLTNFTNAGIIDNTMMNNLETVGDAKISTTQSKFGGSSMYFDGTGDWLVCQDSINQEFGAGNLTWEMWIYTATTTQYATLYSRTPASFATGMWSWMMNQSNSTAGDLALYIADYSAITPLLRTTGVNIRDSAWHHIAVVRNGSAWAIYVDGTSRATATWAGTIADIAYGPYIGADQFYGRAFTGYIDDFRITKGYARYTTNFTPPTSAFPTY